MDGRKTKVYWRQEGSLLWHCYWHIGKGYYQSLCQKKVRFRIGGAQCCRPVPLLRCPICDGQEIELRGAKESLP